MFSTTVSAGTQSKILEHHADAELTRHQGGGDLDLTVGEHHLPAVGLVQTEIIFSSVDFPAPFSPMSA